MTPAEIERLAVLETKVEAIAEKTTSIDSKLDRFIEAADSRYVSRDAFEPVCRTLEDHERELEQLKKTVWKAVGIAAVVAAITGPIIAAVATAIVNYLMR